MKGESYMRIWNYKECDLCGNQVGVNKSYIILKSKNYIQSFAGCVSDNRKIFVCEDCWNDITKGARERVNNKISTK